MKAIEVKHGMSNDNTRMIVIRDDKRNTYIPKGYATLTRLENLIHTHQNHVCLANSVITITIYSDYKNRLV